MGLLRKAQDMRLTPMTGFAFTTSADENFMGIIAIVSDAQLTELLSADTLSIAYSDFNRIRSPREFAAISDRVMLGWVGDRGE